MKAVCLVSSGIDSPVAAYLVSRYVDDLILLHADTGRFSTGDHSTAFLSLANHMKEIVSCRIHVGILPHEQALREFQNQIETKFTCVFCKRMMVRYADSIAQQENADMIVMGDSLGQVASQTLQNIRVVDIVSRVPIVRPLIGFDKQDIIWIAKEIRTYDLSIADAGKCLAVPKKPSTQAKCDVLDAIEDAMDISALVADAVLHVNWEKK